MSFIKKDVNFGLLFLLVILAVALALIGVYYNQNYNSLAESYNSQLANLKKVTEDLTFHKSILNQTASDLKVKEQDESVLNKKYTQLRDEKDATDKENAKLKSDLNDKNSELITKTNELLKANADLATAKTEIADMNRRIETLQASVNRLNKKIDGMCDANEACCP